MADTIFDALRRFAASWVAPDWKWEQHFECVASTFDASKTDAAQQSMSAVFGNSWGHDTLADAPEEVQAIASQTGGLRAGQLLFASEIANGQFAYGMWWPWAGGGTISLRVGIAAGSDEDHEQVREVFGAGGA